MSNPDQSIGAPATQTKAEQAGVPPVDPNAPPATVQPVQNRQPRTYGGSVGVMWALITAILFGLAVTEMGLTAHLFHLYGRHIAGWAGRHMLKNAVGLVMFSAVLTIVWAIAVFWLPLLFNAVWLFALTVFWIVAAGLINRTEPFRVRGCHRVVFSFPLRFQSQCHKFVAVEVIAWWLFGMTLLACLGLLTHHLTAPPDRKRTMFRSSV